MTNVILTVAIFAIVGISILWAFLRGLAKARIRGICVLACAVAAILITVGMRAELMNQELIENQLIPWLESSGQSQLAEILGFSETLNAVVLNCSISLVAPLFCLLLFILLCFFTWFVFLIVTLILHGALSKQNEKSRLQRTRAACWGLIQGIAIAFIVMLPISVYAAYAPTVVDTVLEADVLGESGEDVKNAMETYVEPIHHNGLTVAHRAVGGDAVANWMTDFKINGTKTHLSDELEAVASFACNVMKLTEKQVEQYGSEEAAVFIAIADSFEDSTLLPTIAGEFIYGFTDAWLQDAAFLGTERPSMGEMSEIFDPFFTTLLRVMHNDARNAPALQADIRTVAEMVSVLAEKGVFANLSDTEDLMDALGGKGVINSLIAALGTNESMKVLIPEITNMGIRAIATTLGLPDDVEAVYGELMEDLADTLNEVRALPEEERIETLSSEIATAFEEAGVPIDTEIVSCYAVSMMEDLIASAPEGEDLTAADVQAFFAVYAFNTINEEETAAQGNGTHALASFGAFSFSDLQSMLVGTVYEGKTEADLHHSGAAALANALYRLSRLTETDEQTLAAQATEILLDVYADLLESKPDSLRVIVEIQISKPVSEDTFQAALGLRSSATVITIQVTLEDLLVNSEHAANKINELTLKAEADAITAIFQAANDLSKHFSNGSDMELSKVAGSVGNILDALQVTVSFGSDKTGLLFTAVLQSETVRKTADLDLTTATQMAQKATQGETTYTQIMISVSGGVETFIKLGKDNENLTDKEVEALLRDINPQTAGMIELYLTSERMVKYGVPQKYSDVSSTLLADVFGYMANTEMAEASYQTEAKALNQLLILAISAKSHSSGEKLFGGILPSATETVNSFMASDAVSYSLRHNLLDADGNVADGMFNPFELGDRIVPGTADYNECVAAIEAYYAEHQTEEVQLTLKAVAALLGVSVTLSDSEI